MRPCPNTDEKNHTLYHIVAESKIKNCGKFKNGIVVNSKIRNCGELKIGIRAAHWVLGRGDITKNPIFMMADTFFVGSY